LQNQPFDTWAAASNWDSPVHSAQHARTRLLARRDSQHLAGGRLDGALPECHLQETLYSLAMLTAGWSGQE